MPEVSQQIQALLLPEQLAFERLSPLWQQRFARLAEYAWRNLDQNLDIKLLAQQLQLSHCHLHRMFSAAFDESLASYIRRIRLVYAVHELVTTKTSILDIAIACGFYSSQALAKAMKKNLQLSPSEVRATAQQPGYAALQKLLQQLSPPNTDEQLQQQVKNLSLVVNYHHQQHYLRREVKSSNSAVVYRHWQDFTGGSEPVMVVVSEGDISTEAFTEFGVWVAKPCDENAPKAWLRRAGYYAEIRLQIASELAYFTAWKALAKLVMQAGYDTANEQRYWEYIHNPNSKLEAMDMTFSILLDLNDEQIAGLTL